MRFMRSGMGFTHSFRVRVMLEEGEVRGRAVQLALRLLRVFG